MIKWFQIVFIIKKVVNAVRKKQNVDINLLQQESSIYNNLIEQYDMTLEVIKDNLFHQPNLILISVKE